LLRPRQDYWGRYSIKATYAEIKGNIIYDAEKLFLVFLDGKETKIASGVVKKSTYVEAQTNSLTNEPVFVTDRFV